VAAATPLLVLEGHGLFLIVIMRIFILLVKALIRCMWNMRRIAHESVPPMPPKPQL